MNAARRKSIAQAVDLIAQAKEMLEALSEEEQEYHDNMPENLQTGEKAEKAEAAAEALRDLATELENLDLEQVTSL